MSKTRALCVGLLMGAMMLGSGCKTMATRDTGTSSVQTPAFGGAGLDPNPDHNIPNSPTGVDSSPLREPLPENQSTNLTQ